MCRIGTTFNEFTRCLPASRVETSWAWRSTSRCFITPKRLNCEKRSTISVVVRGRSRRTSRIVRRVGSESAFHTWSRLSSLPAAISRTPLLAILFYFRERVIPAGVNALAVLGIDHAYGTMPQRHSAASGHRFDLNFQVIVSRVRHEHWAAQFQEGRRLYNLHEPPQMSDPVSPVPVPSPTRFWLEQHLHGLPVRPCVSFSETMQDRGEYLIWRGFDVYVLLNVERQVFQCHGSSLLGAAWNLIT